MDRMLIFRERQLRQVLSEYVTHYNTHRAPKLRSPIDRGETQRTCSSGPVRRTQVLGGLTNEYRHAA
jgi:hypothetical protein